jgi:prepilin-type N-terminal cleavage/methylation domain-containing protein
MHLLGFFFLARFNPALPKSAMGGFSLVECMVCLSISAVLLGFAVPSVWRWQERARIDSVRQQLFSDLQLARVRALQWGQRLQMRRLSGCIQSGASATDWSCGWQLSTVGSSLGAAQVISTTSLDASVQVMFAKSTDFFISAQGDLGAIGDRWTVLSRVAGVNFTRSLCINSAGRIRWVEAATCS